MNTYFKVKLKSGSPKTLSREFYPYENLVPEWNTNPEGWEAENVDTLAPYLGAPVVAELPNSFRLTTSPAEVNFSLEREFQGEAGKSYLVTVSTRNNEIYTTRLVVGDKYHSAHTNYVERLGVVAVADGDGKIKVRIEGYDSTKATMYDTWLGGFMITEIEPDLVERKIEELLEIFPFIQGKLESPTLFMMLHGDRNISPYRYRVILDGISVSNTQIQIHTIDSTKTVELMEESPQRQIRNALMGDIQLYSMLEGDPMHISYAYPKEDYEMSAMADSNFPRIQFYTGFQVGTKASDTRPKAVSLNYALKVYITNRKIMESVTPTLIMDSMNRVMASLQWTPIRGSDYFIKQEELYVLEVQYIKDVNI